MASIPVPVGHITEASGEIRVRRGTAADFEAVLDIADDIYDGLDHIPTIYHEYFHSNRHVIYVAEDSSTGQLVGMVNYGFYPDGRTVCVMSARIRKDCRQRGVSRLITLQCIADHPNVEYFLFNGAVTPASRATRLLYVVDGPQLINWAHQHPTGTAGPSHCIPVSHSDADQLITSGQLASLLGRFSVEFVPADLLALTPIRIDDERSLRELVVRSYFVVSSRSDDISESTKSGGSPSGTVKSPTIMDIDAVSFASLILLKTKIKSDQLAVCVFYYGGYDDLVDHVTEHLRHLATIANGRDDVHLHIHFPHWDGADRASVDRRLRDLFGTAAAFVDGIRAYLGKITTEPLRAQHQS